MSTPAVDPRPVRDIVPCRCGGAVIVFWGEGLAESRDRHLRGRMHQAWLALAVLVGAASGDKPLASGPDGHDDLPADPISKIARLSK